MVLVTNWLDQKKPDYEDFTPFHDQHWCVKDFIHLTHIKPIFARNTGRSSDSCFIKWIFQVVFDVSCLKFYFFKPFYWIIWSFLWAGFLLASTLQYSQEKDHQQHSWSKSNDCIYITSISSSAVVPLSYQMFSSQTVTFMHHTLH